MEYIVVQWLLESSIHQKSMRVKVSNHPRFKTGTRFDFGFLEIASEEGYVITVLPSKEILTIKKRKKYTLMDLIKNKIK